MKTPAFKVTWQVNDGYAGSDRPHTFDITADEFEVGDSEQSLKELFWDMVQNEFENHCSPSSDDEQRFIEWAREQQRQQA